MRLLRNSENKSKGQNAKLSEKVKKIAFLALHLGYGGAEKAIIAEANILSEWYDVEIICTYKLNEVPAFELDKRVKVIYLSEDIKPNKTELKNAIASKNLIRILQEGIRSFQVLYYRKANMRRAIKKTDADIIISTRYIYHALLTKNKKRGVITIAQEHNHHKNDQQYIRKMETAVRNIDYFMPVSKELTDFYAKRLLQTKCVYIPHSLEYIPEQVSKLTAPLMIAVGRLSAEKGHLDLIQMFSQIAKEFPEWTLHIVGDGEERPRIEKSIVEYGLEHNVVLHGFQNKEYINKLLSECSIYVMTSYEEAFGIVLIEAQSFGIPCVAYDSARGATEIIGDGVNGYLIKNRSCEDMRQQIRNLIENPKKRQELGRQSRENSLQYSIDNIKMRWFEFIETI